MRVGSRSSTPICRDGWRTFHRARCKDQLRRIDGWLRRKLRCVKLKQCKAPKAIAAFYRGCGVSADQARLGAITCSSLCLEAKVNRLSCVSAISKGAAVSQDAPEHTPLIEKTNYWWSS